MPKRRLFDRAKPGSSKSGSSNTPPHAPPATGTFNGETQFTLPEDYISWYLNCMGMAVHVVFQKNFPNDKTKSIMRERAAQGELQVGIFDVPDEKIREEFAKDENYLMLSVDSGVCICPQRLTALPERNRNKRVETFESILNLIGELHPGGFSAVGPYLVAWINNCLEDLRMQPVTAAMIKPNPGKSS